MAKKNKNLSPSYEKSYGQVAEPELGARTPVHKDSKDNLDSQKNPNLKFEQVRDAEENMGAAKAALDAQLGRGTKTGGAIGDAAAHPQSGCSTKDE